MQQVWGYCYFVYSSRVFSRASVKINGFQLHAFLVYTNSVFVELADRKINIMKHLLFILSLMCSLCLQAKDGKIKYGKYVIYEGGIEKKQPHGQGVLKLINPQNKDLIDATIKGNFEGTTVFNAKITSIPTLAIDNVSNLSIIYCVEKGKCMNVDIVIDKATITSNRILSLIKQNLSTIKIESPLKLSFYLTSLKWVCNTKPYEVDHMSHEVNHRSVHCYCVANGSYLPDRLSPILSKLQYSMEMIEKVQEIFIFTEKEGNIEAISYAKSKDPFSAISYYMNDGTIAVGNKIYYPNKERVEYDEKSLSGTRTFSDGTKISHYGDTKNINIKYSNGNSYTGTIKEGVFYPFYANVKRPTFTYDTGTQIVNGVTTKWIDGETFEARHERLESVLSDKLLTMVEENRISEEEAVKQQILAEKKATGASFEGDLFEDVHPTAKILPEPTYYSYENFKIKKLMDDDVIGYFDIEGIKTELQKEVFIQSDEYKIKYLPKFQKDKKNLLEEEFYFTIPIKTGSPVVNGGEGTTEVGYKYDINTGRIEFALRDTENAEVNKGETSFHVILRKKCLTYPRSLVSLHSFQNLMHTRTYDQKLQTCKVSQASALKIDNNSCDMLWMYKITKFKNGRLYCKTTHLYIVNRETKEIYCDLTKSLEASHAKFKSDVYEKDQKTYHKQGRVQRCEACLGTGLGLFGGSCIVCNGTLYYTEHWW